MVEVVILVGLLWVAFPAVVFGLLMAWASPDPGPPSRTRVLVRRCLSRAGDWITGAWRSHRPAPPPPAPDPFVVLSVQMRLGMLAEQIRRLEDDPTVWARGRRLAAVRAAYDDLLHEACRLAGVDLGEDPPRDDPERFREEMELTSRGWSW